MKEQDVGWLRVVAVVLAALACICLRSGGLFARAALALEPVQAPTRSLSSEEIRALQEGEEMGLARTAELNGYPNPARILEAAQAGKIDLFADQRQAIERIQAAMKAKAQSLGRELLAEEAALEAGFRTGRIADAELARQVEDIGRKLAELRLTHLRAHLLTADLLRPEQIEEYYQFRGYPAPAAGHGLGH
jgi:hypothetical protein